MTTNKSIFAQQREFMEACDLPASPSPCFQTNQYLLWMGLIREEWDEFIEAANNLHHWPFRHHYQVWANSAQEAIDLIYVLCGYLNALGMCPEAVWNEVQRANMDKVGPDGKVTKNLQGKVLKPEGWERANIYSIMKNAVEESDADVE